MRSSKDNRSDNKDVGDSTGMAFVKTISGRKLNTDQFTRWLNDDAQSPSIEEF